MSMEISITTVPADKLDEHISGMNQRMTEWTAKAARGECGWICSDCCSSFPNGMPDECDHGIQRCTDIIKRDKMRAMKEGNEPQ